MVVLLGYLLRGPWTQFWRRRDRHSKNYLLLPTPASGILQKFLESLFAPVYLYLTLRLKNLLVLRKTEGFVCTNSEKERALPQLWWIFWALS